MAQFRLCNYSHYGFTAFGLRVPFFVKSFVLLLVSAPVDERPHDWTVEGIETTALPSR